MNNVPKKQLVLASLVADKERPNFLPSYLGQKLMFQGEKLVYSWLHKLSKNYKKEYLHYYTLSNGGFYMAPKQTGHLRLEIPSNGFKEEMSADAAGIVATMFALSQLLVGMKNTNTADTLIDRYLLLSEFVTEHSEADLICRAID